MRKVPSHPPAHLHSSKMPITTKERLLRDVNTLEDKNNVYEKMSLLNAKDSLIKCNICSTASSILKCQSLVTYKVKSPLR